MTSPLAETLARSACYKLLSLAFLPPAAETAHVRSGLEGVLQALPDGEQAVLAPVLGEARRPASGPSDAEHTRLFGVGLVASPYESEYDPLAPARKGHRLADLLGFYEAFGMRLAEHRKDFPDHVAAELEFMALLLLKAAHAEAEGAGEARAVCQEAASAFLADHLAAWGGAFADRVEAATEEAFYRFAARLLRGFLRAECQLLKVEPAVLAAAPGGGGSLICPLAGPCSAATGGGEREESGGDGAG